LAWTQPITLDASGRLTSSVYVPEGDWKFLLTDSADVTVTTEDDIPGGLGTVAETDEVLLLGKHSIWVPASAMLAATTNGPATAQLETTTNKQNYKVLDFDASTDEYAHFQIAFPKGWNKSTITYQVFWSSTATDTDGVAMALQAVALSDVALSDNEAIDATWGTAIVVTDDAQSAAGEVYVSAESSPVTIAGTPLDGDIVFFRLFRDVSDGNDGMTEDLRLIGVKIFYTLNAGNDA